MLGRRTLIAAKNRLQDFVYSALHLEDVQDRAEQQRLTLAMGFAGQWDEHRRFQMELLKSRGADPSSRVLEIGCGPLTLGVPLIGWLNADRYVGVDVRSSVAAIAYSQIGKQDLAGKNPRIIVSTDFASRELEGESFDVMWSFSVLYHLADPLVERFFAVAALRLAPKGRLICNINISADESTWLEFPFVKREVGFYTEIGRRAGLSAEVLGPMKNCGFRGEGIEKENVILEFRRV